MVIYIYNGLTALDAIGPYEVLSRLPNANVKFVAKQKGKIITDTQFLSLQADYSIDEINNADILLIPGSTITFIKESKDKNLLSWINKIHSTTQFTTSVCSGSIILASVGLLKNKKATSHWGAMNLLEKLGAIPTYERYVEVDKIITASGVSAGIDMSLFLASKIFGEEKAKAYQLLIEYNPKPPFKSGDVATTNEVTQKLAKSILLKQARKELSFIDVLKNLRTLLILKK